MKQELKAALEKAKHVHDLMRKMTLNVPWLNDEEEDRFYRCMWAAHDKSWELVMDLARLYDTCYRRRRVKLPQELRT